MKFVKIQGLGNDYLYFDGITQKILLSDSELKTLAIKISNRHFGVGADGIILVLPSLVAHFKMRIFNADGSEARSCGNGLRGVAKYVFENQLTQDLSLTIETLGGIIHAQITPLETHPKKTEWVTLSIPFQSAKPETFALNYKIPMHKKTLLCHAVNLGNPHCVTFVKDLNKYPFEEIAPQVQSHSVFPEGVNAGFAQILSKNKILLKVWERGSGPTLACGTGACAAVAVGILLKKLSRRVEVSLPGGTLWVEWKNKKSAILLSGPTVTVFQGEWTCI